MNMSDLLFVAVIVGVPWLFGVVALIRWHRDWRWFMRKKAKHSRLWTIEHLQVAANRLACATPKGAPDDAG